MKTTNRIHRNGATKPASSQAKTHNEFKLPKGNAAEAILEKHSETADKSGKKSKPEIEYVGKYILNNFWVKIGFSREELGALRSIAQSFLDKKNRTVGKAAALVLTTALMHWEKLDELSFADKKYAQDEGFLLMELFAQRVIAKNFNLAAVKKLAR